jgi:hypothetical protein
MPPSVGIRDPFCDPLGELVLLRNVHAAEINVIQQAIFHNLPQDFFLHFRRVHVRHADKRP